MDIMILKKIKEKIKEEVKLVYTFPNYRKYITKFKKCTQRRIILIGTPAHGNLGDQAIAVSELEFIKDHTKSAGIFEIPMPLYKSHRRWLKKHIRNNDLIIISGGGWMGNVWVHNEITIRDIVEDYCDNKIIIFPQTLYYTNDAEGMAVAADTRNVFKKQRKLYLAVRDSQSYKCAEELLGMDKEHLLFCPDMALYGCFAVKTEKKKAVKKTALVCLRQDVEKLADSERVKAVIESMGYTIKETSTVLKHLIKLSERKNEVRNLIRMYSCAHLMVTDRLHAMIFSLLAGIPCFVFDNSTGKVFGVASYLVKEDMSIKMFQDVNDIGDSDFELEGKPYELDEALKEYFQKLAEVMNTDG